MLAVPFVGVGLVVLGCGPHAVTGHNLADSTSSLLARVTHCDGALKWDTTSP